MARPPRKEVLKQLCVYISPQIYSLIENEARDDGISVNKEITKILTLYATKDIEDESLLIQIMRETKNQIEHIDKKLDLANKLEMQFQVYLLSFMPELPSNQTERAARAKQGNNNYSFFLNMFKKRVKTMPSMLEAVLGDMLEEDVSQNEGGQNANNIQ